MARTNEIITTTDYSIFRKMHGNRGVDEKRIRGLVSSIKKIGWISNPIIVNDKMEVVDGQGRLEALKRLGLPVEYHIVKNASLNECRTMNTHNSAWKINDYVESYAQSGLEQYKRVLQLMKYYNVSLETILIAADKIADGRRYDIIRDGGLEFTNDDFVIVSRRMNIYKDYYPAFEKFGGQRRTKEKVIFYLIKYSESHEEYDHKKMIEVLTNCDPQKVFSQNFERLLESVQDAWNYNRRKKSNRMFFYEEYRLENKVD